MKKFNVERKDVEKCINGYIISADENIIEMMFEKYLRYKIFADAYYRNHISFSDFMYKYAIGRYEYTIRQGWEKIK